MTGKATTSNFLKIEGGSKGEFVNFTTADGLADNRVQDICCDSDGSLWIGTLKGVSRYDGREFTTLAPRDGLVDRNVNTIRKMPDGKICIGTMGGLSFYDKVRGHFGNPSTHSREHSTSGEQSPATRDFASLDLPSPGGALTTDNGLVDHFVHALYGDSDGVLWLGTNGGVCRYDGKTLVHFIKSDGLAERAVLAIYRDSTGGLWFGTQGGVSYYDEKTFFNFTTADGLGSNHVNALHRERNGSLWVGTDGGGVSYDDSSPQPPDSPSPWPSPTAGRGRIPPHGGQRFTTLSTQDGLINNYVYTICQDSRGSLWFGTGSGISRYGDSPPSAPFVSPIRRETKRGKGREGHGFANLPTPFIVLSIHHHSDGTLWFGLGSGCLRYDEGRGQLTGALGGVSNPVAMIQTGANGELWFAASAQGVFSSDGISQMEFSHNPLLAGKQALSLYPEPGGLWIGTSAGVYHFDGHSLTDLP